jgi:hypothetical protein
VVKTTIANVCKEIAAIKTGRRPMWSESLPTVNNAASTVSA